MDRMDLIHHFVPLFYHTSDSYEASQPSDTVYGKTILQKNRRFTAETQSR